MNLELPALYNSQRMDLSRSSGKNSESLVVFVVNNEPTPVVAFLKIRCLESNGTVVKNIVNLKQVSSEKTDRLMNLKNSISSTSLLRDDWNSYGSERPNSKAQYWANRVLDVAHGEEFLPTSVQPSAEGGIALCFMLNGRYCDVECFNTGEILAVKMTEVGDPEVWTLGYDEDSIRGAIQKICEFLNA